MFSFTIKRNKILELIRYNIYILMTHLNELNKIKWTKINNKKENSNTYQRKYRFIFYFLYSTHKLIINFENRLGNKKSENEN